MDFFDRQQRARRQTLLLMGYFVVAVALIIAAVNALAYAVAWVHGGVSTQRSWWLSPAAWWITFFTLLVILSGSISKYLSLRSGGPAVAQLLKARAVPYASDIEAERRLINVTEEMAIASGVVPPALFIMDAEPGINAFVAGLSPNDTVMVVTKGAVDQLTRDELQAVAGHEFSHILNGDARLNLRMLAVLAGIVSIGQLGDFCLRVGDFRVDYSSRRQGEGEVSVSLVVIGFGLASIGAIGLFFGRLIKAGISRQRELLADASSVQFTRNADGLIDALARIRDFSAGSQWRNRYAEDFSHMCFGRTQPLRRWFATHPSLDERILAIDPTGLARVRARRRVAVRPAEAVVSPGFRDDASYLVPFSSGDVSSVPVALVARAGEVRPEHMQCAREIYMGIPAALQMALQSVSGARDIVYVLFLREWQADSVLVGQKGPTIGDNKALSPLKVEVASLPSGAVFSLFELAIARLKVLPVNEKTSLLESLTALALKDGVVTYFELVMLLILERQLGLVKAPLVRYRTLASVQSAVITLVAGLLRHASGESLASQKEHFSLLIKTVYGQSLPFPSEAEISIPAMYKAIRVLGGLPPVLKRTVLDACYDTVMIDGKITSAEHELLRAISAALDVPLPPLVGMPT